jgi:hypothetical protein
MIGNFENEIIFLIIPLINKGNEDLLVDEDKKSIKKFQYWNFFIDFLEEQLLLLQNLLVFKQELQLKHYLLFLL